MRTPVHAGTGERWQLFFVVFLGRASQMHFHRLALSIDAFKFIKDEVKGIFSRVVYSDGGEMPSL